jgi:hypothetical protein
MSSCGSSSSVPSPYSMIKRIMLKTLCFLRPITVAILMTIITGCGGASDGPKQIDKLPTVPVSGSVKLRGAPLPNVAVMFQTGDGKTTASGTSDTSGNFKLSTYGKEDGAPVGTYKIMVVANLAKPLPDGGFEPIPETGVKSPIPAKYGDLRTTDIIKEVPSGGGTINIELK